MKIMLTMERKVMMRRMMVLRNGGAGLNKASSIVIFLRPPSVTLRYISSTDFMVEFILNTNGPVS